MIYGVVGRAWHGKWYGLVGIASYLYWTCEVEGHWHVICYCLVEYGMVGPVGHDIVYLMAWLGMERYIAWHCLHGMVYGMAWRGMTWHIVWPGGQGIVYDEVCRGMAWYVKMLM